MEQLRREEERRHAEREQVRKHLTDRCHTGGVWLLSTSPVSYSDERLKHGNVKSEKTLQR